MKNYSRKKSTPGKVAYRTPSRFRSDRGFTIREEKAHYALLKGKKNF